MDVMANYWKPYSFCNMAAPLKKFIDSTTAHWFNGTLRKVRRSIYIHPSMHGGQETTLMSMILPLLHHGMIIAGVPTQIKI